MKVSVLKGTGTSTASTASIERHLRFIQFVFVIEVLLTGFGARESGDDGFYIAAAHFVSKGLTPFIDFSFSQGPLLAYIYAPVVYLLGPTLLASRVAGIALSLLLYAVSLRFAAAWSRELDDESHRTDPALSKLIFTYVCVLYPEVWAILSRIGTKEALASLCCLLSVAGLFSFQKTRWNLIVSSFFVAVSFGIKYTSLILLLPLALYIGEYFSIRHAVKYCFLVGFFTLLIFLPYLATAQFDSVIYNFRAVKQSLPAAENWIERSSQVFAALTLSLGKYQLLLIPTIAVVVRDLTRVPFHAFLTNKRTLLIVLFIYASICILASVSPAEHRVFMYVPLLLISSAISIQSCVHFIDDHFPEWRRRVAHFKIGFVLIFTLILSVNSSALAVFGPGLASINFSAVRWYVDPGLSAALMHVDELCRDRPRTLLYVGYLQHHILPSKCVLSPLSSMSAQYLGLSSAFSRLEAERYGFLSSELFLQVISDKRFDVIVIDNALLEEDATGIGIAGAKYRNAVETEYSSRFVTKYMSVFEKKAVLQDSLNEKGPN